MKKVITWLLTLTMLAGSTWVLEPQMMVQAEEPAMMTETEPLPLEQEEAGTEQNFDAEISRPEFYSTGEKKAILGEASATEVAKVTSYPIEVSGYVYTDFSTYWTYSASRPSMIAFFDYKGCYNVAYLDGDYLRIQRYNKDMVLQDKLQIEKSYSSLGNVTCDDAGNYYVVWGQSDSEVKNCVTISVKKYNYQGEFVAECAYKGYETWDNYWGTKDPFRSGNCSLTIHNGVLAVNYARTMYSGHQSNYIIYVDCKTMKKLKGENAYSSHSFDQRIIGLSDGGFLAANHGDAFPRSFTLTKISADREYVGDIQNFHFREGSNRSYGYNETYAQMGSIAETKSAYIFCGSSERTLSLETAPTNQNYCGHSEAKDLFIQILKKDFCEYVGVDKYLVTGEKRVPTGKKPTNAETNLYLHGSEADYGVLWLTAYDNTHYVCNPKMVPISDNQIVVMWEKRDYAQNTVQGTYYAVLDERGNVLVQPMQIVGVHLTGNIDPVCKDGKVYWATSNDSGAFIHCLTPAGFEAKGIYIQSADRNGFVAGLILPTTQNNGVEYRWTAYYKDKDETMVISDWKKDDEWLSWTPENFGEYVLTAEARMKDNPSLCVSAQTESLRYSPHIKGICQMPYTGEGGGYLIGVETYENPNQSYQYEMLILDCTLLAQGKDAWVWTTGKYTVPEGNAGWCIWQPQYGYYWTLFRVYDAQGNMIDQNCYGFVNAY